MRAVCVKVVLNPGPRKRGELEKKEKRAKVMSNEVGERERDRSRIAVANLSDLRPPVILRTLVGNRCSRGNVVSYAICC